MTTFVDPLSSLGGFQNQALARFTSPMNAPSARPGGAASQQQGAGPVMPESLFGGTMDRASRQHQMYMQALQSNRARQEAESIQPTWSQRGGGGGGAMTGRYNLVGGAAQALQAMNAAFRQQFGYDMKINEGGRTRERQQYLYDLYKSGRGNLAARPGTSLHESGRAIDLGGAFQNANSREHRWLQQNAGRWGYKWTGKNFKQFEPWHWEWMG